MRGWRIPYQSGPIALALCLVAQGCGFISGSSQSGTLLSARPLPPLENTIEQPLATEVVKVHTGKASWYGPRFEGKKTASGEAFNSLALTAAHRTFPLGSRARVTNLENNKSVIVEINDRGPFIDGRIIDLSHAAAKELGMTQDGTAQVKVELLSDAAEENAKSKK
jgi:rare lipoprotein A